MTLYNVTRSHWVNGLMSDHSQITPMSPQPSYPAPQGWMATSWTPLSCDMAGCWQINSILASIGRKNSIWISNQYPFLYMKNINMNIVYLFHQIITILKNKVVLISCSWPKAAANNGLMALIRAHLGVARLEWGQSEVRTSSPGSQAQMGKFGWCHVLPVKIKGCVLMLFFLSGSDC